MYVTPQVKYKMMLNNIDAPDGDLKELTIMHVIGFYYVFFSKVILIIFFSTINGMAAMFWSNAF